MRACPVCGASNGETDDFCGNCGAYLGWSGSAPTRSPAGSAGSATDAPDRGDDAPPAPAAPEAATAPAATEPPPSAPSGAAPAPPAPLGAEPVPSASPGAEPVPSASPRVGSVPSASPGTAPPAAGSAAPQGATGSAALAASPAESAPPTTADTDRRHGPHPEDAGADRRLPWKRRRSAPSTPADAGSGPPPAPPGGEPAPPGGEPARSAPTTADRRPGPAPADAGPTSATPSTAAPSPTGPDPAGPRPPAGRQDRTGRGAPGAPEAAAPRAVAPRVPAPAAAPPAAAPRAVAPQVPDSPQPVRPAKAVAPRPVVRTAAVSDSGSGVPCPACGTPNPPDRRFCRRCAAPLTPTTTAAPLPWWRTVWPLRRRTRGGSGRATRFLVVLAVVLALCAGGFLLLPAGRHLIEDTRDKLGKAKEVTATRVEASAELPGHPVGDSTDGLNNRYWGAPGLGASATYTFAEPFRLVDVIITNGASASPEEYARQARALRIDMEVTTRDGRKVHKRLDLSDKPGPQTFPTGISDALTIRLTLDAPAGAAPERHLALAEVEFFRRG
ncbi:NADase-type glycan-binding domain-containing protein [Streptomyces sp. NPDC092307]|uniref:NADase-type glycan-binding domain-containing protein n=1 Tax=Streptomyces sp. NPDC092307 TaxID=3366013 RepID=UPI003802A13F